MWENFRGQPVMMPRPRPKTMKMLKVFSKIGDAHLKSFVNRVDLFFYFFSITSFAKRRFSSKAAHPGLQNFFGCRPNRKRM